MPEIIPLNESSLLLQWKQQPGPALLRHMLQLHQTLQQHPFPGYSEAVTAYNSMAVFFEPTRVQRQSHPDVHAAVAAYLLQLLQQLPAFEMPEGKTITIPVCYDADFGPDLMRLTEATHTDAAILVQLHGSRVYDVYAIGFMPGFPYLGFLPEKLQVPRRARPRTRVAAGSVAVAGTQTGIYPFDAPGGWHVIGNTPLQLFNPERDPPFLLQPGDRVQFQPISKTTWQQLAAAQQPASPVKIKNSVPGSPPILQVEQGGFGATLHDGGRTGYRNRGLPPCGPAAPYYAKLANLLVGNVAQATVLELPQAPYRFRILQGSVFACTGGGLQPTLDGKAIALNRPFWAGAGSLLELRQPIPGFRLYLAASGGWAAEVFLGSTATDLRLQRGGLQGRTLQKGDLLHRHQKLTSAQQHLAQLLQSGTQLSFTGLNVNPGQTRIQVLPGPEWNSLSAEIQHLLQTASFRMLPESNRTGWRISGPLPAHVPGQHMYSAPVTTGTVQYTPSGELLVLGPDGPTMGGYPRVLQLTVLGLNNMAQLRPGMAFTWVLTDFAHAEQLYLEQEAQLQRMAHSIQSLL